MGGLLSLAFAAGMVAPVNPCGFALLVAASRLSIFVPLEARARSGAAIQKKC